MEPGKDYVLIHNGPEAGRADGQGRGSAQLPVVDHRSHVPLHPHGFERLAERITLLARLRPDAGSGQRNTGLAGLRHGRRFPLPKQPGMRLSIESAGRVAHFTPIRRVLGGSIQQRPALRRDQQRRRPAPSGRKGSTGNRSPKRPHSPSNSGQLLVCFKSDALRNERGWRAVFSADCLTLSVGETSRPATYASLVAS